MRSIAERQNRIIKGILGTKDPSILAEVENYLLEESPCPAIPADTPEKCWKGCFKSA